MPVPIELQPRAVAAAFERISSVETPLARFFPAQPNTNPGTHVTYDVLEYSRIRGEVNTRGGEPKYVDPPTLKVVDYEAFTWREGIRISAQTMKDLRAPGEAIRNRGRAEVARALLQLRLRYERFLEWLRAQALQGVITYKPRGSNTNITELVITDDSYLVANNHEDWSSTPDATLLNNMRLDFEAAKTSIAAAGCRCDTAIMNSTTRGYIDAAVIAAAGDIGLKRQVVEDGGVTRIFGVDIVIDDETYIHPLTGQTTKYVPDNVVVFTDSNAVRAGRVMRECEALHTAAPAGTTGLWFHTYEVQEAPGEVRVSGEWTGGPEIAVAGSLYVYTDVTAGPS